MTPEEVVQFRTEFKKIVYHKGLITNNRLFLTQMQRFDKNDSHKNAILKALTKRDELIKKFNEMLCGLTYDEWKELSSKISRINEKISRNAKHVKDLDELKSPLRND